MAAGVVAPGRDDLGQADWFCFPFPRWSGRRRRLSPSAETSPAREVEAEARQHVDPDRGGVVREFVEAGP
jgi:hypothetical protein